MHQGCDLFQSKGIELSISGVKGKQGKLVKFITVQNLGPDFSVCQEKRLHTTKVE
jgi:hypothetical protein